MIGEQNLLFFLTSRLMKYQCVMIRLVIAALVVIASFNKIEKHDILG